MSSIENAVPHAKLSPAKGLIVLICVIAVISGFIALSMSLNIHNFWPAFLFVLYWASIDQARTDRLLADALGAAVGMALAYCLWIMQSVGMLMTVVVLLALVFAIYCTIMSWLPSIINTATMLFLTVCTIPAINSHVPFVELASALGLGIFVFGGLGLLAAWCAQRRAQAAS
ncbi:hypothetical protein [Pseudomonas sp. 5P_3.1_Bac2]|uniref:hypothetical protein n=1 Tax=Pseudomonas sp. 5P_3.1_Bac2 TaxID=2971617 RepID=UPI0021C9BB62|nr:hypothetical protein [Pseudomonas sp. 5P_3.1_Bac2]MCU1717681.1 hypothetical protein [Pseudomonas sp. 5P_3.1_Bac2]